SFGVVTPSTLRPGKRGKFETDAWSFDFEPAYDENYVYLDGALNSRVLAALRLASTLNISVDGREIADMALEDTGVDGVLDALIDCSNGESGWWGEGLQIGPSPAATRPGVEGGAKGEAVAGGSGSAFFITPEGFAVTAAHVVEGCRGVDAPRWGAGRVVAVDRPADLAILKFATGSGQVLALRGRGPRLGEPMSAGGFPLDGILGGGLKITTGVVSGLSGLQGDRGLFQISAPIQPGNSGGPVVDGAGALIGVVAAKLDELKVATATGMFPQNVNFAVPSPILQAFLDENGLAYRSAPATPGPAVGLASVTFSITCQP
ncbi:MAG: S1C family serine protease, partial [Phenylobacterium sp.]|nr:S1C family serine protease [Phenylobacterium sp.]